MLYPAILKQNKKFMRQDSLKLYLFNVGAGDHLMLEFPDRSIGIIDSFFTKQNLGLDEPPALTYLKYRVSEERRKREPEKVVISFICISHSDIDHVKHIDWLFAFIKSEQDIIVLHNLWLFGGHPDGMLLFMEEVSKLREQVLDKVEGEQKEELLTSTSKYLECLKQLYDFKEYWHGVSGRGEHYFNDFFRIQKYGQQPFFRAYSLGPITHITNQIANSTIKGMFRQLFEQVQDFANPLSEDFELKPSAGVNKNSISAILGIHFHNYNLIFSGDATIETLNASLNDIPGRLDEGDGDLLNPNFYKASHHGAKTSTSPDIWGKMYTAPKGDLFVGISAGSKHSHPHTELLTDVVGCCKNNKVRHNIYRTNQCLECRLEEKIDEVIDCDPWFRFHGCPIEDYRVLEGFHLAAPDRSQERPGGKNLLAFIFEFPPDGGNGDIKVYKGVSEKIGKYTNCVFSDPSANPFCTCKNEPNECNV